MKSFLPYIITGALALTLLVGVLNPFPLVNPDEGFATEFASEEEELRELASIEEASLEESEKEIVEFSESASPAGTTESLSDNGSTEKASEKPTAEASGTSTGSKPAKPSKTETEQKPSKDQPEKKPSESETAVQPIIQRITGFEPLNSSQQSRIFAVEEKPSLKELLKLLPETLQVYIDQGSHPVSVPVKWSCVGDDYQKSELYYFQFSPKFGKNYELASYLDPLKDAPYIMISLVSSDLEVSDSLRPNTAVSKFYANQQKVYRYLTKTIGFNEAAACGIMANIEAESGFNPTIYGDNGHSYGICQWNLTRMDSLISWCKAHNHKYNTLNGQLNYLKYELSKNDATYLFNGKTIYNKMMAIPNTATGAYEAGALWCKEFERPADKVNAPVSRGNRAKNYYWANLDTKAESVSISDCTIKLSRSVYTYSGNACVPTVKVKNGSTVLNQGSDYRLAYSNNVEPGTATVDIIGIGDYTGSATRRYTIQLKTPEITSIVNKVTGIRIDWKTVPGASGYYVLRRTHDSKWTRIKQLVRNTTSCYIDRTAEDGVEYIYSIRAYTDTNRLSDYDREGETISRLTRPTIYGRSNEISAILLKWDAVHGADGYIVYRSVDNEGYARLEKVDSGLSYLDTTATKDGATYQYKVRAYTNGQTSAASPEVIKVRMSRTRITGISNPVSGQMKVEWTKKEAARGYQVQYCTDSDFPKASRVTRTIIGKDNLSITIDKNLQTNTRYYVRARTYVKTKTGVYFSEWSETKQLVVR